MRELRLGTRSSPLAMWQANVAAEALRGAADGLHVEVVAMTTSGDVDQRPLAVIDERGIFAKELEQALLAGTIDVAVHSCKDLRHELPEGLVVAAMLEREDPRDAICGPARSIDELPQGARIATGSRRRAAALRALRGDLVPTDIRGNVQTRLQVARERGDDGCMLAAAGLRRLGLEHEVGLLLAVEQCVPEPGQGAIALQVRAGDAAQELVARVAHDPTTWAVSVERRVAAALGGGCEVPLGVHVRGGLHDRRALLFAAGAEAHQLEVPVAGVSDVDEAAAQVLAAARDAGIEQVLEYSA